MTTNLRGADPDASAHSESASSLRSVANRCTAGSCPTIYQRGSGTLVVQGFALSPDGVGVDVPNGEMLVEIPLELLTEAARNLS